MTLDEYKAAVETAEQAAIEAAQAREKAIDDYDTARVAAMDPAVVTEAQNFGINPRNFEDTAHLQTAIDTVKTEVETA